MAILTPTGPSTPIVVGEGVRTFRFTGGACGADDTIKIATGSRAGVPISFVKVAVTGGGVTRIDPEFHRQGETLSAATRLWEFEWPASKTPGTHVDGAMAAYMIPVDASGDVYLRPQPDGTGTAYDVTIMVGSGVR
jgi:hypothetical protein